ncbi:MAG: arginase family protein [Betaproteobacteria bacterium]|nr:arginase family protein [Betaproteobacteria bacterium]
MTPREIIGIISRLSTVPIKAIDLAEVSPPWDPSGIASRLGVRILLEALAAAAGGHRFWTTVADSLRGSTLVSPQVHRPPAYTPASRSG